jgi:hypothetical protein
MKRPLKPGVFGHASFEYYDEARVARIRLDRWWDPTLDLAFGRPCDDRYRPLVVVGINPSDADGENDDNTISKVITFARREGANGVVMVNLHPGISTEPDELARVLLPYGANDRHWEAVDGAIRSTSICSPAAAAASEGKRRATGRSPDVAVNHWPAAIAMHEVNHPDCIHLRGRLQGQAARGDAAAGACRCSGPRRRALLLSREGRAALARDTIKIRGLAWSIMPWIIETRPDVIFVENVVEFLSGVRCAGSTSTAARRRERRDTASRRAATVGRSRAARARRSARGSAASSRSATASRSAS